MIISLTDQNFTQEIKNAKIPFLVDFWANWCLPCRFISPLLENIAEKFKEKIIFAKVNIDEAPIISQKYNIDRIPYVLLFKNGEPKSFFIGLQSEENIEKWLEENL